MKTWQPWSLSELVHDRTTERVTGAAVLEKTWSRIAETESAVSAWATTDLPSELDATGLLGGVPLGVKDIIDVAGLPTRCGSKLRADHEAVETDAAIVTAWRRAGAVPVGKTVTTEFAFFAPGATRNPADLGHTPGGSSSGSAAAVASGQVPLAIGSQTAGSVTRPVSYCGVAALVMSRGRFALDGVVGLSPSRAASYSARVVASPVRSKAAKGILSRSAKASSSARSRAASYAITMGCAVVTSAMSCSSIRSSTVAPAD